MEHDFESELKEMDQALDALDIRDENWDEKIYFLAARITHLEDQISAYTRDSIDS